MRLVEYGPTSARETAAQRGIAYLEHQGWRHRAKTIEKAAAIIDMSQRMVKTPDGAAGIWGAIVSGNTSRCCRPDRISAGRYSRPTSQSDGGRAEIRHVAASLPFRSFDHWTLARSPHGRAAGGAAADVPDGGRRAAEDFEFPTGTLDFVMPIALDPSRPLAGRDDDRAAGARRFHRGGDTGSECDGHGDRSHRRPNKMPPTGPRFEYQSLKERLVAPLRPALRVILAAVAVLLLIVCANAANLLLARGTSRRREIAVRLAVGASRMQVFRQVLLECAVLAGSGGVLGALLGAGGVVLVRQLATVDAPGIFRLMFGANILPRANEVSVDWRLFAIAFAIATVTAFTFGLLPALQLSRANHLRSIGSRGGGTSRGESRLRNALTLAQLTMATVLLTGAALLTTASSSCRRSTRATTPRTCSRSICSSPTPTRPRARARRSRRC